MQLVTSCTNLSHPKTFTHCVNDLGIPTGTVRNKKFWDKFKRMSATNGTKLFIIQAILAGSILCIPGNITTIIMLASPTTEVVKDSEKGAYPVHIR